MYREQRYSNLLTYGAAVSHLKLFETNGMMHCYLCVSLQVCNCSNLILYNVENTVLSKQCCIMVSVNYLFLSSIKDKYVDAYRIFSINASYFVWHCVVSGMYISKVTHHLSLCMFGCCTSVWCNLYIYKKRMFSTMLRPRPCSDLHYFKWVWLPLSAVNVCI